MLTDDFKLLISGALKRREDSFIKGVILPLDGKSIELPEKFIPELSFLARHREEVFLAI